MKGRPYTWFRAALQRGDLLGVRAAAAELAHVGLADAAGIVALMSRAGDPAYERAAVRWVARLAAERPDIGLEDIAAIVATLLALPHATAAREQLAEVCARHDVTPIIGLPVRSR